MTNELSHVPVLLDEALGSFTPGPEGVLVDCTFGRGGHTRGLLEKLGPGGRLLAIDRDPEAVQVALALAAEDPRLTVFHASFDELGRCVSGCGIKGIDGVLFDLGVSSPQLDDARRGFSFQTDGPLDMRMDSSQGVMAADWLAGVDERELVEVLRKYGEERYARRIAKAIVSERSHRRIETTMQLADIVTRAVPTRERSKHPATRVFQAIRILINDELGQLERALAQAIDLLNPGARVAVISFHSLEDGLVKRMFRARAQPDTGPFAVPHPDIRPTLRLIGKPVRCAQAEHLANRRARSATLRVAEKC